MKVYELAHMDASEGACLSWHASKNAVAHALADIRKEHGRDTPFVVTPHDIPTDRDGLISWLNTHVTTDNG